MKIFFAIFALLAVMLAVYPFLGDEQQGGSVTGLPWQIDTLDDGSTRVFGLHIGVSRLADALAALGDDMELAIIASTDVEEVGSLEMYYGHYRAGLLSGKLILHTATSEDSLKQWRDNAEKSDYMSSGYAKKYTLSVGDKPQVLQETISGITFIPAVNLDEEIVLARFGEPAERIEQAGTTHYLYPEKGLDIAVHEKSKEVMQYVAPSSFDSLLEPLR